MRRSTVVLFALLALPLGGSHAQQPQPTFRVTANYIEVDATVTDARGAFVRDLSPDDFEVVDEGKPQSVTVLSLVDLPFERPDRPLYRATAVEPDVISNATADSGRIYVIVLDAYHVGPARTTDTRTQARQFIEKYFQSFPKVRGWIDATLEKARTEGYVETLLGRKRRFPELVSGDSRMRSFAENAAVNTPVQGSAADVIKKAMIVLEDRLSRSKLAGRMLLQVHDELLLEVPERELDETRELVRDCMMNAVPLRVPLKVDFGHGKNWLEAH